MCFGLIVDLGIGLKSLKCRAYELCCVRGFEREFFLN